MSNVPGSTPSPREKTGRGLRGKLGRVNHEPSNRAFPRAARCADLMLKPVARLHYSGQENLPMSGGVIIAPNHISNLDWLVIGHFLSYSGRWPYSMARDNLFDKPVLGRILKSLDQIPVMRGSSRAGDSLSAAQARLEAGCAVVIYPEGTFTYDPEQWPMAGHTGAARLALRTGVPVIPVGQWGGSVVLPPRGIAKPKLIGRTDVSVHVGTPVELGDLIGRGEGDRHAVHDATVRIMNAITHQVASLRGCPAPELRWHPGRKQRIDLSHAVL